jgi:hypothetical protein
MFQTYIEFLFQASSPSSIPVLFLLSIGTKKILPILTGVLQHATALCGCGSKGGVPFRSALRTASNSPPSSSGPVAARAAVISSLGFLVPLFFAVLAKRKKKKVARISVSLNTP